MKATRWRALFYLNAAVTGVLIGIAPLDLVWRVALGFAFCLHPLLLGLSDGKGFFIATPMISKQIQPTATGDTSSS